MPAPDIASLLESLPRTLHGEARAAIETFLDAGGKLPGDSARTRSLVRLFACSPFAARVAARQNDAVREFLESGLTSQPISLAAQSERIKQSVTATDEASFMNQLRQLRQRECFLVAWREIVEACDVDESMNALSNLADHCIRLALRHVTENLRDSHGVIAGDRGEPQQLIVVGLGKLGAAELNFSSDVDLLFAYPRSGESDGKRSLHSDEYFSRLAQRFIRVLDLDTPDGFVYRVDMRLRPFGDSGPLVMNFNALENYYQEHGREWERYALIKARPITGSPDEGRELLKMLRPFVFRRYLDYGIFESLREMKAGIAREVARKGSADNIKIGPGGIREIEFFGQSFQLIRGGREPAFQRREILAVLRELAERNYITSEDGARLASAYRFLRRVENILQAMDDAQVHDLPKSDVDRARLVFAMKIENWNAFRRELEAHRAFVADCFDAKLQLPELPGDGAESRSSIVALWQDDVSDEQGLEQLRRAGYQDPARAWQLIESTRAGILQRHPGERGRKLLDRAMPALIDAAANSQQPEQTLERVLKVIDAIALRTAYIALLVENPGVLSRLANVVSMSSLIAGMLVRHPVLLDELIDPRVLDHVPVLEELKQEFDHHMANFGRTDVEARMEALNAFQQVSVMRIALADVLEKLPLMKVSDHLTRVAEFVVRDVMQTSRYQLEKKYGEPSNTRFCIVAYGKFGGLELGYGSDLDLVFIHDATDGDETAGPQKITAPLFYLRLVQRIINWLSTSTHAGILYQVDTRLRPSGTSGLLVTSITAFERYQEEEAWSWEHQALFRARAIAGDAELMEQFESLRHRILGQPRDPAKLRERVREMREKMLAERADHDPGFDPKRDRGGMIDVEFLVQYLVLAHAAAHPALLEFPDTVRGLEGLETIGVLTQQEAQQLSSAYQAFRAAVHRAALQQRSALLENDDYAEQRERVLTFWQRFLVDAPGTR